MAKLRTILGLFPFLTKGHLALTVFREMRHRGLEVVIAYSAETKHYVPDLAEDFAQDDRLVDLSKIYQGNRLDALEDEMKRSNIGLVLQIGASPIYRYLPFVKEQFPEIAIVDVLYNEVGHVVSHFLFESAMDGVLVESDYMGRYVERSSAKKNPNIRVVKNGVDLETFTPSLEANGREGLALGYLGRMSAEKNPFGFIALAEQIYAALPDSTFPLGGEGNLAADVRARIKTSGARGAFRYDGHENEPQTMLRQLDALIVPSLLDGRPNVIMEANACGVPVIAAPVGGIPEMIEDGVNGHLFPATAVEPILQVLSRWRHNRQSLVRIKRSSRNFADRFFDRKSMLDRYEEVFLEFLDFAQRPTSSVAGGNKVKIAGLSM
jgi:glycosyltransferase involved in cell wall biosynthesis